MANGRIAISKNGHLSQTHQNHSSQPCGAKTHHSHHDLLAIQMHDLRFTPHCKQVQRR